MPNVNAISSAWNPITKPLSSFMCYVLQFAAHPFHHLKALPAQIDVPLANSVCAYAITTHTRTLATLTMGRAHLRILRAVLRIYDRITSDALIPFLAAIA
jgi:hypothetical protein